MYTYICILYDLSMLDTRHLDRKTSRLEGFVVLLQALAVICPEDSLNNMAIEWLAIERVHFPIKKLVIFHSYASLYLEIS